MSKKITVSLGICLALVCLFAGCIKREFSNDKWRVTVVSFEFLEADGDYDNPFLKEACKDEPLAIHLKLDYISVQAVCRGYLTSIYEKVSKKPVGLSMRRAWMVNAIKRSCKCL